MTPEQHTQQRDAVRLSLMLAPIHADRRDRPLKKVVVVAPVHVFVIPVVTEKVL